MTFQKGHIPLGRALKGHLNSEETKKKIKAKAIERYKNGVNPLKGRRFSEEHRKNLSKNHSNVSGKNNPMYGKKRNNPRGKDSPTYKNGILGYRKRALAYYGQKCGRCGIEDIRVLLVHHKDRNRKNNEIENFEILCRNCHILEHWEEIFKKKKE